MKGKTRPVDQHMCNVMGTGDMWWWDTQSTSEHASFRAVFIWHIEFQQSSNKSPSYKPTAILSTSVISCFVVGIWKFSKASTHYNRRVFILQFWNNPETAPAAHLIELYIFLQSGKKVFEQLICFCEAHGCYAKERSECSSVLKLVSELYNNRYWHLN